ncbi:MAG: putative quinol monooxygenase [Pseudomonadota bacterium]
MSFAVLVRFQVKPDHMSAFLALMHENAGTSLSQEPGCSRFDVLTDQERPNQVFLYEIYNDRDAFEQHLESDHFKQFESAVIDMVMNKQIELWDGVFP